MVDGRAVAGCAEGDARKKQDAGSVEERKGQFQIVPTDD